MNFKTWAPLWCDIVDSSVWDEPYAVRVLFTSMLALKDADHVCRLTTYQLRKRANMPEAEVLECLKVLASPDKRREESQPFEGRRIKAVEDGWLILNGEKYKERVQKEAKRARDRKAQAAARARAKEAAAASGRDGYAEAHGVTPRPEELDDADESRDLEHEEGNAEGGHA